MLSGQGNAIALWVYENMRFYFNDMPNSENTSDSIVKSTQFDLLSEAIMEKEWEVSYMNEQIE